MSQRIVKETLGYYRRRYKGSNRAEKRKILDHFCQMYGYHRKAAVRRLNGGGPEEPNKPKRGPKRRYDARELLTPLKAIWFATNQICSKKLKAALPLWLPYYEKHHGTLSEQTKQKLLSISAATLDRLLQPTNVKGGRRGLSGTRPGTLLKHQIPIKTEHWDVTEPGFMEADTVAHCGTSLAGNFVWSLTLTDIYSGWTECRATWNKGATGVLAQIKHIEDTLPFALQGFDCDNGSEFLNYHLLRYFHTRKEKVAFTRSRPYRKNDNAHVEQKNWTHVRQLFGYDRFGDERLVVLMNDLYAKEWSLLLNFFHPSQKLKEKNKINSKYQKKYFLPQTPYQRLMESASIPESTKMKLRDIHASLDPFLLKRVVEEKLRHINKLISVTLIMRQRIAP